MKLSGFVTGFKKFFSTERVIILTVFILLGMFLLWYSSGKLTVRDNMSASSMTPDKTKEHSNNETLEKPDVASYEASDIFAKSSCNDSSSGYVAQPVANPSDLLPHDSNSEFAKLNPASSNDPALPDLLQAGTHIGINTVGQSLRNANLQLRSDPPIPKSEVGPWNNSTIEADPVRQPLEVG